VEHPIFGEVISAYSRAQAIEDGELVDVSQVAAEAGFKFPVAMTRTVWGKYVEVPRGVHAQDEQGRLWDILNMARYEIHRNRETGTELRFQLHVRQDNRNRTPPLVTLKLHIGPGDDPEPVLTILLLEED